MTSHEEDPELEPCYRHSGELTALHCITCERPICVDCAIAAPVGFKCPEHGRASRAERGVIPFSALTRGFLASLALASVLGIILTLLNIPFIGLILAYAAGMLVGEAARYASGGYRDPLLAKVASICSAAGLLALPAVWLASGQAHLGQWLVWQILAALAAAWGAYSRSA